jgi:hypothetical protein
LRTGALLFHLLALMRLYDAGSPPSDDLATLLLAVGKAEWLISPPS